MLHLSVYIYISALILLDIEDVSLRLISYVAIGTMNLYAKFEAFNTLRDRLMPFRAKSTL